jgi:hypothetical protein
VGVERILMSRKTSELYQQYIITGVLVSDCGEVRGTHCIHVQGFSEVLAQAGVDQDADDQYRKALDRAESLAEDLYEDMDSEGSMLVEVWGLPYPKNGGENPPLVIMAQIDESDAASNRVFEHALDAFREPRRPHGW